jgi:OmpA-OmpF porin, OOP family
MSLHEDNGAERVVFWVVGAIVTALLAGLIAWKLFFQTPTPAIQPNIASAEQSITVPVQAPAVVESQPIGDDLPKSLGELDIEYSGSSLTLRGEVPTERKKERLLSQARLVFGMNNVVDAITVRESAMLPNWKGKTLDLMAKLATLGPFSLKLANNQIALRASVPDATIKSAWIDWLANFFVDQPLAVDASALAIDSALPAQASFDVSTLFNMTVNFASGSADIPPEDQAELDLAAEILAEDGRNLRIIGHTDSTGDADANRTLSNARAKAVADYLISKGVAGNRLSSYGLGQDQPIADNATEDGRARNRRIEFAQ